MSGYILCQTKRAEVPYYIENISTNIYSIEELCFYLYHNIYLLDETLMNEELCFWIRDELGLKKLGQKLYRLLDEETKAGDFILPVFKEINYLSMDEFRQLNKQIQMLAGQPEVLRQKIKGDYLMEHGKYGNAIKVYQKALKQKEQDASEENETLGKQFVGGLYHNMGCAYTRLFQMEAAIYCFEKGYEHLHTMAAMKSYLYALYMEHGSKVFERKAAELGLEGEKKEELLQEIEIASKELFQTEDGQEYKIALEEKKQGHMDVYHDKIHQMLQRLTKEYHRSTGF